MPRHSMTVPNHHANATAYTIAEPVDENGACTLYCPATNETYRVVDYGDPLVRERLAGRTAGGTVRLDVSPTSPDGRDWIAMRLQPGAPLTVGGGR